jgi:hypothetical protein
MDSAQKQEQSSATRCLGGCGFYGCVSVAGPFRSSTAPKQGWEAPHRCPSGWLLAGGRASLEGGGLQGTSPLYVGSPCLPGGMCRSDATQGFCSVCWKAHQSSAALAAASSPSQPAAAAAAASPPETHFAETAPAQQAEEAAPPAVAEPAVEAAAAVPCEPADEKPVQVCSAWLA